MRIRWFILLHQKTSVDWENIGQILENPLPGSLRDVHHFVCAFRCASNSQDGVDPFNEHSGYRMKYLVEDRVAQTL